MMEDMSSWAARIKCRFASGEQESVVAVTYLLLTAAMHAAGLQNQGVADWREYQQWWPVPLAAGALAILWRRRRLALSVAWQLAAAALLLALGSMGAFLLLFEAVFSIYLLGAAATRRAASILVVAVVAGSGVVAWQSAQSVQQGMLALFLAGFILLTPAQWATNVRNALELAQTQQQRAEALHRAAADREELLEARHRESMAEERTALAREMHDVLSARFSSIALLSGALLDRVAAAPERDGGRPDAVPESLRTIRSESLSGLAEMTQMVRMLHARNTSPLVAGLDGVPPLVDSFRRSGSRIEFACGLVPADLPDPRLATAVYRTLNELLVNHAKHAPAQPLQLEVQQLPHVVLLRSTNPLAAQPASELHGAGTGLGNIRARAQALGGRMDWGTANGQFTVRVELPLADPGCAVHEEANA